MSRLIVCEQGKVHHIVSELFPKQASPAGIGAVASGGRAHKAMVLQEQDFAL